MNSFLISVSPVENILMTRENYGKRISQSIYELFPELEENILRVSSFFGYFFENNFTLEKNKNYKIMITIKKTEYFSSIIQKLFRKGLNKEIFLIDKNEFVIKGIISNDKIWTEYYNFEEIIEKNQDEFFDNFKIKIVTPIVDEKDNFVFGFEKIFDIILKNFSEYCNKNFDYLDKEEIFFVKKEKYYTKDIKIKEKIKKSYLGEIEINIKNEEYKNLIYAIFLFAKFYGIGKMSEYGFGQIILKN